MKSANTTDRKDTYRLGIDLGGTKTEAVLLDPGGHSLLRKRMATPRDPHGPTEYEKIRDAVGTLIQSTLQKVPQNRSCTVGVGIPGTINMQTGQVQNANTTSLIGQHFQQDLEQFLDRPIGMQNDANCFTLAEARQGAGQGFDLVFGVIMGTGCGGGISDELYTLGVKQVRRYAFHEKNNHKQGRPIPTAGNISYLNFRDSSQAERTG